MLVLPKTHVLAGLLLGAKRALETYRSKSKLCFNWYKNVAVRFKVEPIALMQHQLPTVFWLIQSFNTAGLLIYGGLVPEPHVDKEFSGCWGPVPKPRKLLTRRLQRDLLGHTIWQPTLLVSACLRMVHRSEFWFSEANWKLPAEAN